MALVESRTTSLRSPLSPLSECNCTKVHEIDGERGEEEEEDGGEKGDGRRERERHLIRLLFPLAVGKRERERGTTLRGRHPGQFRRNLRDTGGCTTVFLPFLFTGTHGLFYILLFPPFFLLLLQRILPLPPRILSVARRRKRRTSMQHSPFFPTLSTLVALAATAQ